jgi:hypothetical protein
MSIKTFLRCGLVIYGCLLAFRTHCSPVVLTFDGNITQIQDPYGSHLADSFYVGQPVSYQIVYDLGLDGFYRVGGSLDIVVNDEQQVGYSRDYFYAALLSDTYMHGNFSQVQYFLGRNEWPTGGNDYFMTRGMINTGPNANGDVVIQRMASVTAYDPSYFVQNWVIGDQVQVQEQAWADGPTPNQPYQTSFSANMVLTKIESVPEPSSVVLLAGSFFILLESRRRGMHGKKAHYPTSSIA